MECRFVPGREARPGASQGGTLAGWRERTETRPLVWPRPELEPSYLPRRGADAGPLPAQPAGGEKPADGAPAARNERPQGMGDLWLALAAGAALGVTVTLVGLTFARRRPS